MHVPGRTLFAPCQDQVDVVYVASPNGVDVQHVVAAAKNQATAITRTRGDVPGFEDLAASVIAFEGDVLATVRFPMARAGRAHRDCACLPCADRRQRGVDAASDDWSLPFELVKDESVRRLQRLNVGFDAPF